VGALSPSLSLSAASDRLLAAGEQVGSGITTSERREARGEASSLAVSSEAQNPPPGGWVQRTRLAWPHRRGVRVNPSRRVKGALQLLSNRSK